MEVLIAACGSLISASIEAVVENLSSSELLKFIPKSELIAELQNWETWLMDIKELLKDAEGKQTTDPRVKKWLDRLRDLAYDIEDVLAEFSTEALKHQVAKENSYVPSFFLNLSPAYLEFKDQMASKMKDITERLQLITTQVQTLNLKTIAGEGPNKRNKRSTSSLVVEKNICGRNAEKEDLVQMLVSHEGRSNPFSVIHILGMGGIGKTTLAQLVYNDYKVQVHFDIKVWVCVSENFDVEMLTREILRSITRQAHEHLNFNLLQEELREKLSGKKFLLILDDVWEQDYSKWDKLCRPFFAGAAGSKIVITTRKEGVASRGLDVLTYPVKELPDDECLSLLACHALDAENFDLHLNLKDIALDMVKKCRGLPLAAKVLGGLLRNKPSPGQWESVLRSEIWNLAETSSDAPLPVLKLSYNDLPPYLKRCFAYCAIFPKDYEFDKDELVLLWMAEGFLQLSHGEKQMEDVGIDYFEELVSRSLFQLSNGNPGRYVMHDLINDLAQYIEGNFCYNYEKKIVGSMSNSKFVKVRHASIGIPEDDDLQEYGVLPPKNSLRTILCFLISKKDYFVLRENALPEEFYNILFGSKYLRVLSLPSSRIRSLPDSIGDLKLLRHLDLSFTWINQLPYSVSSLFNLLTLILTDCTLLQKLPDKIENLVNLHHLDISKTYSLREIPSGIGMLTNLQTLSKFVVNESHGTTIAELENLNNLRGILSIEGLDNVTNLQDAKSANLKAKQGVEELVFKWNHHHGGDNMSVLESLEPPHQNLKRLTIDYYGGSEFPSWVSDSSFSKLVSLKLSRCLEIKFLPALHNLGHLSSLVIDQCLSLVSFASVGLLSCLEDLQISSCYSLKYFGRDFKLPTTLKIFKIQNCPSLLSLPNGLTTSGDNTNLEVLTIIRCKQLASFPHGKFPVTLKTLKIEGCSSLVSIAPVGLPNCLEDLRISDCASLKCFGIDFKLPTTLKIFRIKDCPSLLSLPNGLMTSDDNTNPCHSHLEVLIMGCKQLTFSPPWNFPTNLKTVEIWGHELVKILISGDIFCNNMALQTIKIEEDDEIRVFPSINGLQSLRELTICRCSTLKSFPEMGLCNPALQFLVIRECRNLSSLPNQMDTHLPSLQELTVSRCPCLVSLTQGGGGFPKNLTSLLIEDCENLRQPMAEWGLHLLSSLGFLCLKGTCSAFSDVVSFQEENHCLLPTSLCCLKIRAFMNLESLGMGLQKLNRLHSLSIDDCPKLPYLPKEALPSSLEHVYIENCPLLKGHFLENKGEYPSFIDIY